MITQEALDAAQAVLTAAYSTVSGFETLEILTYWPPPLYNPPHDYMVLHEGTEADALISMGGQIRSTPTGNGMPYIPDWLMLLYRQRPITQQTGVDSKGAQDRMRQAKVVLGNVFKAQPGLPVGSPQAVNLLGTVAEAGKLITVRHPLTGPYEADAGQVILRFSFLAGISLRSSVH